MEKIPHTYRKFASLFSREHRLAYDLTSAEVAAEKVVESLKSEMATEDAENMTKEQMQQIEAVHQEAALARFKERIQILPEAERERAQKNLERLAAKVDFKNEVRSDLLSSFQEVVEVRSNTSKPEETPAVGGAQFSVPPEVVPPFARDNDATPTESPSLVEKTVEWAKKHPIAAASIASTVTLGTAYLLKKMFFSKEAPAPGSPESPAAASSKGEKLMNFLKWIPILGLIAAGIYGSHKLLMQAEGYAKWFEKITGKAKDIGNKIKEEIPGTGPGVEEKYGITKVAYDEAVNIYRTNSTPQAKEKIAALFGLKPGETNPKFELFMSDMDKQYGIIERDPDTGVNYVRASVALRNYEEGVEIAVLELGEWLKMHMVEVAIGGYISGRLGILQSIINSSLTGAQKAYEIGKSMAKWGIKHPFVSFFMLGGSIYGLKKLNDTTLLPENLHQLSTACVKGDFIRGAIGGVDETMIAGVKATVNGIGVIAENLGPYVQEQVGALTGTLSESVPEMIGLTPEEVIAETNGSCMQSLRHYLDMKIRSVRVSADERSAGVGDKAEESMELLDEFETEYITFRCTESGKPDAAGEVLARLTTALAAIDVTVEEKDSVVTWKTKDAPEAFDLCVSPRITNKDELKSKSEKLRYKDENFQNYVVGNAITQFREEQQKAMERGEVFSSNQGVAMVVGNMVYAFSPGNMKDYVWMPVDLFLDASGLKGEDGSRNWTEFATQVTNGAITCSMFTLSATMLAQVKRLAIGGGSLHTSRTARIIWNVTPGLSQWNMARGIVETGNDIKNLRTFGFWEGRRVNTVIRKAGIQLDWPTKIETGNIDDLKRIASQVDASLSKIDDPKILRPELRKALMRKMRVSQHRFADIPGNIRRSGFRIWEYSKILKGNRVAHEERLYYMMLCKNAKIEDLVREGVELDKLLKYGVSVDDLVKGGASIENLVKAGASVDDLLKAGVSVNDLILGGAKVDDLINAGFRADDLFFAGAKLEDLVKAGASVDDLLKAGANLDDLVKAGAKLDDLLRAGVTEAELLRAGASQMAVDRAVQAVKAAPKVTPTPTPPPRPTPTPKPSGSGTGSSGGNASSSSSGGTGTKTKPSGSGNAGTATKSPPAGSNRVTPNPRTTNNGGGRVSGTPDVDDLVPTAPSNMPSAKAVEGLEAAKKVASPKVLDAIVKEGMETRLISMFETNPEFAANVMRNLDKAKDPALALRNLNKITSTVEDTAYMSKVMATERGFLRVIGDVEKGKDAIKALNGAARAAKLGRALKFAGKGALLVGDALAVYSSTMEFIATQEHIAKLRAEGKVSEKIINMEEQRLYYLGAQIGVSGVGAVASIGMIAGVAGSGPVALATLPVSAIIYGAYEGHKWRESEARSTEDWKNEFDIVELLTDVRTHSFGERVGQTWEMLNPNGYEFVLPPMLVLPSKTYDFLSGKTKAEAQSMAEKIKAVDENKLHAIIAHSINVTIPETVKDTEDGPERPLKPEEVKAYQETLDRYVQAKVDFFHKFKEDDTHIVSSSGNVTDMLEGAEYSGLLAMNRPVLEKEYEELSKNTDRHSKERAELIRNILDEKDAIKQADLYGKLVRKDQVFQLYKNGIEHINLSPQENKDKREQMRSAIANALAAGAKYELINFQVRCEEENLVDYWQDGNSQQITRDFAKRHTQEMAIELSGPLADTLMRDAKDVPEEGAYEFLLQMKDAQKEIDEFLSDPKGVWEAAQKEMRLSVPQAIPENQQERVRAGEKLMKSVDANYNGHYYTKQFGWIGNYFLYATYDPAEGKWMASLGELANMKDPSTFRCDMWGGSDKYNAVLDALDAINHDQEPSL